MPSEIRFFLTAYDPSDLPGGSIDPLDFERGYLLLADKILPGMTNVASCPRYFSLLCAGAWLAGDMNEQPVNKQKALPNAAFLAFTGTSLIGKGTRCQIFISEGTSNLSENLLATSSINP